MAIGNSCEDGMLEVARSGVEEVSAVGGKDISAPFPCKDMMGKISTVRVLSAATPTSRGAVSASSENRGAKCERHDGVARSKVTND